ncbi:MAG: putative ABC transporter permease [Eubacterium sp.]|nr:putative ABC transporter permease [Eubacterium sp.]
MKNQRKPANDEMHGVALIMAIIVCAGIFGWIYETLFYMYNYNGRFVMRGTGFGPWIDVYCLGGVLIYFACRKLTKRPWLVFLVSGALCGALEYAAGFILDRVNGGYWGWNYNTEKLNFGNINGYICLRSVLVFAVSGCILFYAILPGLNWLWKRIGEKAFSRIFIILGVIVLIDIAYNDIACYMFGMPDASQLYSRLG